MDDAATPPYRCRGHLINGHIVLIGTNKKNPELVDAAVVYTDIRLSELDPNTAIAVVGHAITEANLPPLSQLL